MGYDTHFEGRFELDRPLAVEHAAYLRAFVRSRRMTRYERTVSHVLDPVRTAAGLPVGEEGGYCLTVETAAEARNEQLPRGWGLSLANHSIADYNRPPLGQPGLWCRWQPTEDDHGIAWDGTEKFYEYAAWLVYLVQHFLEPWGYVLDRGRVQWRGDDADDRGILRADRNHVYLTTQVSLERSFSLSTRWHLLTPMTEEEARRRARALAKGSYQRELVAGGSSDGHDGRDWLPKYALSRTRLLRRLDTAGVPYTLGEEDSVPSLNLLFGSVSWIVCRDRGHPDCLRSHEMALDCARFTRERLRGSPDAARRRTASATRDVQGAHP